MTIEPPCAAYHPTSPPTSTILHNHVPHRPSHRVQDPRPGRRQAGRGEIQHSKQRSSQGTCMHIACASSTYSPADAHRPAHVLCSAIPSPYCIPRARARPSRAYSEGAENKTIQACQACSLHKGNMHVCRTATSHHTHTRPLKTSLQKPPFPPWTLQQTNDFFSVRNNAARPLIIPYPLCSAFPIMQCINRSRRPRPIDLLIPLLSSPY